jgi:hypothetical protein
MSILGLVVPAWARWALLLAVTAAAYIAGHLHQAHIDQAEQLEIEHARTVANVERLVRRAKVVSTAAAAFEADRTAIQTKTQVILKEIEHVVDRPVYRDCRLDPDGLRLVNEALGGSPATIPAGVPPDPVPSALPGR